MRVLINYACSKQSKSQPFRNNTRQNVSNEKCYVQTVLLLQPHKLEVFFKFHHFPTALSMMRWSSLFHSSTTRRSVAGRQSSIFILLKACPHWRQKSPKTDTKIIRFRRQMDTNGYFLSPFSATFVAVFGDELRILFVSVFGDFCRQCGQAFTLISYILLFRYVRNVRARSKKEKICKRTTLWPALWLWSPSSIHPSMLICWYETAITIQWKRCSKSTRLKHLWLTISKFTNNNNIYCENNLQTEAYNISRKAFKMW